MLHGAVDSLASMEIAREQRAFSDGRERYLNRLEKNNRPSTQNNPHTLITKALPLVSQAIKSLISTEAERSAGRRPKWFKDLVGLDPDILAYIGLNACMDTVVISGQSTCVLTKIGHRIELESWSEGLLSFDKKLHKNLANYVTREHAGSRAREKAAKAIASKSQYSKPEWQQDRRVEAAGPVRNCVLQYSGIFEEWTQYNAKGTVKRIGLTEVASQTLADMDFESSWQEPMLAPMIVEPKPWTAFNTGCYYDKATAAQVPLVRAASKVQRKAITHQLEKSCPDYLEAINAIQATPLTINKYVLEAVEWTWQESKVLGKFPRKDAIPFPERVENFEQLDKKDQQQYVSSVKEVRLKNREIDGARALMMQDLGTAKDLSEFDEFWLPFNFDFRGRVYPVPHFSYHRDDHVKAMFLLKNGKPVDDTAAFWMAVHLANVGDFDRVSKKSLEERAQWCEDNSEMIYQVGRDFKGTFDYWSQADKPYQFIAACHEFANYMDYGSDYVSGLPPALDGTNSGIQHYAAASLDEDDGKLVNLVPSDAPQDVYKSVADMVNTKLAKDDSPEAAAWSKHNVTRSTVKRNVMTYGYSSGKYGFADQLMEDVMRPLTDKVLRGELGKHPFGEDKATRRAHSKVLAHLNYESVCEVISSAAAGMAFFQKVAGALAHEGKALRFTNPVGFPVIQQYTYYDVKKVKLYLYDRTVDALKRSQVSVRVKESKRVDKKKAKAAVSPNIIHSMDSSHLLLTVLTAKQNGVNDFFLIHDSFATTAADTDIMYQAIRASFVELYSDYCLYDDLLNQASKQLSYEGLSKLDVTIPKKGSLDLSSILDSEYCFS
jgi:DNA-directed RNA polymerase, mitochondrial